MKNYKRFLVSVIIVLSILCIKTQSYAKEKKLFCVGYDDGTILVYKINGEENMPEVGKQYQGPVRPTDDELYFRETGITMGSVE